MEPKEFATKIKEKYPQYQGVDDNELTQRMLEKYPQYRNRVSLASSPKAGEGGGLAGAFREAGEGISEAFHERTEAAAEEQFRSVEGEVSPARATLRTIGQGAGFVGDVGFEALKLLAPKAVEDLAAKGVEKLGQTELAQRLTGEYQQLKDKHPEAMKDVEAVFNIGSLLPIGKGTELAARGVKKGGQKAIESGPEAAQKVFTTSRQALQDSLKASGNTAVKSLQSNYEDIFQSTKPLRNAHNFVTAERGFSPSRVLAERKMIIDVQDGKFVTKELTDQLDDEIAEKSTFLDKAIAQYPRTVSIDDIRKRLDKDVAKNPELRSQARVGEVKKRAHAVLDEFVGQERKERFTLSEIQTFKKGMWGASKKFKDSDVGRADAHSELGSVFRRVIEDYVPDVEVRNLNRQIGELEETFTLLEKHVNGTAVKGGRLGRYFGRLIGATLGTQGPPILGPILGALGVDYLVQAMQKNAVIGPLKRAALKYGEAAPDQSIVDDTLEFINAVEAGEKALPTDEVLELMARLSIQDDIKLLPEPLHREIRSQVSSGGVINLPEKSQTTLDREERQNPNIKKPNLNPRRSPATEFPTRAMRK